MQYTYSTIYILKNLGHILHIRTHTYIYVHIRTTPTTTTTYVLNHQQQPHQQQQQQQQQHHQQQQQQTNKIMFLIYMYNI